ncbi:MAG: tetratricopeptide repeat protein [Bacteroidia bacterium]
MARTLRQYWFWWLVPVLITYIVLYPVNKNGFVDFDDGLYITKNKLLEKENPSLADYFSPDAVVASNYHPLTILSLKADYAFAGKSPSQYHSTNLLLHTINAFLVFLLVYFVLYKDPLAAAFVALVFGLHPMHVESVAWISERKDVLYLFFFLLSMLCFYARKQHRSYILYFLSLFFFLCSLLSKSMAVVLPLLLILTDWYKKEKNEKLNYSDKIPFFVLAASFGIFAYYVQHKANAIAHDHLDNFFQLVSNSCYSVLIYLGKFILPIHLSPYIVYPELYNNSFIYPASMYWAPVIFFAAILTLYFLRKNKIILFGLSFFYISVFFVSQIIPFGSTIVSERYTYLAYIGLSLPLGAGLSLLKEKQSRFSKYKTLFYAITLLWLGWLSYTTHGRTAVWKNSDTLWADAIEKLEKPAVFPYHAHASYLANRSEIDIDKPGRTPTRQDYLKAIREMNVVVSMDPKELYIAQLAYYYGFAGIYDSSVMAFNRVLKINPREKLYYTNKIISLERLKDLNGEYQTYSDALNYFPNDTALLSERALLGIKLNKFDSVIRDENKLLAIDPDNCRALVQISIAYYSSGNTAKAKEYLEKAAAKGYPVEASILK